MASSKITRHLMWETVSAPGLTTVFRASGVLPEAAADIDEDGAAAAESDRIAGLGGRAAERWCSDGRRNVPAAVVASTPQELQRNAAKFDPLPIIDEDIVGAGAINAVRVINSAASGSGLGRIAADATGRMPLSLGWKGHPRARERLIQAVSRDDTVIQAHARNQRVEKRRLERLHLLH